MERLKLVFETDKKVDIYKVRDILSDIGLKYKSAERGKPDLPVNPANKKGCCGAGEKQSPPMLKKANNYRKTMTRWVKAGMPIVSLRAFAERLAICGVCDSHKGYECTECGCPMDNKAKMDIDKLCELKKW